MEFRFFGLLTCLTRSFDSLAYNIFKLFIFSSKLGIDVTNALKTRKILIFVVLQVVGSSAPPLRQNDFSCFVACVYEE